MKLSCSELAELLLDYMGGELAEDRLALLESHLGDCQACVIQVETYRVLVRLPRRLPARELPAGTAERLVSVLRLVAESPDAGELGEAGSRQ